MNKLSIYVSTFDGYSDLWDTFFKVFDKYFFNCPYDIYMTTNYKDYEYRNLKIIKTGQETTWMNRIKKSIMEVDSEYILFMLEDYLIGRTVDVMELDNIIDFMDETNANYYRLQEIPKSKFLYNGIKFLGKINSKQKYGINTICSIWRKDFLIEIIKEAEGVESAWDFEVYLCNKFNAIKEEFIPDCYVDKRDLLAIKNGVYRGVWFRSTIKYFKKEGLEIDTKGRKIMTFTKQFTYDLKMFILQNITLEQKEFIKKVLRMFGKDFLSDKKVGGLK